MSDQNQHIDQETFELYLSGKLSPEEQYKVERQLEASAFEQEAMEGLESVPVGDWKKDLEKLNKDLAGYQAQNKKFNWYSIAAVIALLVVSTWAIWIFVEQSDPTLALEEKKDNQTTIQQNKPEQIADTTKKEGLDDIDSIPVPTFNSNSVSNSQIAESQTQEEPTREEKEFIATVTESSQNEPAVVPETDKDQIAMVEEVVEESEDAFGAGFGDSMDDEYKTEGIAASQQIESEISGNTEADGFLMDDEMIAQEVTIESESNSTLPTTSSAKSSGVSRDKNSSRKSKRRRSAAKERQNENTDNFAFSDFNGADISETEKTASPINSTTRALNDDSPSKSVSEQEYQKYINENLVYPTEAKAANIEGSVKLIFTVNIDSTVTDFIVLQGLGYGCDEEAIRLVKEGPKWIPLLNGNKPKISDGFQEIQFFLEKK
ncbi:MAG: energy transducer TonB [bacterium]|nr:energy transducer TonB [bacterium]